MKNILIIFAIIFLINSCSINYKIDNSKKNITYYKYNFFLKKNILTIISDNSMTNIDFLELVKKYLNYLTYYYINTNHIIINLDNKYDYYYILYKIGNKYFDFIEVPLIKYGLIQLNWLKLYNNSTIDRNFENENLFIIKNYDFDNFIKENQIKSFYEIYAYIINFLLKNIYFVSIQEILERPYRYLNISEINTIFYQVVISPEITIFTEYLVREYGVKRTLEFAKLKYKKENCKKIFGIEINEIEENFTKKIENKDYNDLFKDKEMINKLDNLLTIYNTSTKTTLFKK